ncbi:hypothetical protein HDU91_004357, partial [Kappamyces sp. JEL0680]
DQTDHPELSFDAPQWEEHPRAPVETRVAPARSSLDVSRGEAEYFLAPVLEKVEALEGRDQFPIPSIFEDVSAQVYMDMSATTPDANYPELNVSPQTLAGDSMPRPVPAVPRAIPARHAPSLSAVDYSSHLLAPIHTYHQTDMPDSSRTLLPPLEQDIQAQVYMDLHEAELQESHHIELSETTQESPQGRLYTTDDLVGNEIVHFKRFLKSLVKEVQSSATDDSLVHLASKVAHVHNPLTGKAVGSKFLVQLFNQAKAPSAPAQASVRARVAANAQATELTAEEKELLKAVAQLVSGSDTASKGTSDLATEVVNSLGIGQILAKL